MELVTEIIKLAYEFAEEHKSMAEQFVAWGSCDRMTHEFIRFARDKGYMKSLSDYTFDARPHITNVAPDRENPAPEIYDVTAGDGTTLYNESRMLMCTWHCIVECREENLLIDFTARQYRKDYAFPLFIHKNDIAPKPVDNSLSVFIAETLAEAAKSDELIDAFANAAKAGA